MQKVFVWERKTLMIAAFFLPLLTPFNGLENIFLWFFAAFCY